MWAVGGEFPNCAANTLERTRLAVTPPESDAAFSFTQDAERGRPFKRLTRREVRRLPGSRRHRRLIEPATVWLPSIRTDTRAGTARVRARFRRCARSAPHAFDGRYSNVGNRGASSPDPRPSRTGCGPDIRAEWCQSAVQRRDGRAARTA